jgi:serine/threonine-protein kinase RsbW
MNNQTKELKIPSALMNLSQIEKFVEEICDQHYLNDSYFGNILVTIEEAVKNSIIHGNKNDINKKVIITYHSSSRGLTFRIEDEGEGFDYSSIPDLLECDESVAAKIGKGIFLIRALADNIFYNDAGNSIEITFDISSMYRETTLSRINKLHQYFEKQKSLA